jgi:hypothetical protein
MDTKLHGGLLSLMRSGRRRRLSAGSKQQGGAGEISGIET